VQELNYTLNESNKKKRLTLWRKKIWEDFKKIHKNQLVILEKIQGLIVPYYAKK